MSRFRRPGLQDDEDELQPVMLRPRPAPTMLKGPPAYSSSHHHHHQQYPQYQQYHHHPPQTQHEPASLFLGDEDSVVSGLSAMSDLESLYVESSSKNRPSNAKDQYLLAQRLPGQATSNYNSNSNYSSNGVVRNTNSNTALLNGFAADDDEDDDDNWQDMVYAATLQQSHQTKPRKVTPKKPPAPRIVDPAEQEQLDLNRAIAASRLMHEEEQMRLAQILEDDDEEMPSSNKQNKSKKKDKKKKGLWSTFTGKKNSMR